MCITNLGLAKMDLRHFTSEADVAYSRVETDGVEHVVDLGAEAAQAAVDVVDDTVLVVLDDEQYEITTPRSDPEAFIRNGVLTIRTEDTA